MPFNSFRMRCKVIYYQVGSQVKNKSCYKTSRQLNLAKFLTTRLGKKAHTVYSPYKYILTLTHNSHIYRYYTQLTRNGWERQMTERTGNQNNINIQNWGM